MQTLTDTEQQKRFERLPKWAQDEIGRLKDRVRHLTAHIADLNGRYEHTDTFIDHHGDEARRFNLPRQSRVTFAMGLEHWNAIDVHLDAYRGDRFLQVRGRDSRLVITPESGNTIVLRIPRDR